MFFWDVALKIKLQLNMAERTNRNRNYRGTVPVDRTQITISPRKLPERRTGGESSHQVESRQCVHAGGVPPTTIYYNNPVLVACTTHDVRRFLAETGPMRRCREHAHLGGCSTTCTGTVQQSVLYTLVLGRGTWQLLPLHCELWNLGWGGFVIGWVCVTWFGCQIGIYIGHDRC